MLTDNWYTFWHSSIAYDSQHNTSPLSLQCVHSSGDQASLAPQSPNVFASVLYFTYMHEFTHHNYANVGYVSFGSGTTAPTRQDYKLSGASVSSKLTLSCQQSNNVQDNKIHKVARYTAINNTTADITIGEIGYWIYSSGKNILLDRTVLDPVVTIPANGGIGVVTYEVTFDI